MKKLGPICLIVVLALVALLGGAVLMRNTIIKFVIERGVKATTGVGLTIQKMSIGLTTAAVEIKGLRLHNPWGFHEDLMMDMPLVSIDVDAGALFKNRVHIESMRMHLSEFIVIKNSDGKVNINALKPVKEGKQPTATSKQPAGKAPKVQIDYLEYTIGKVVYKDYSQGKPAKVQEFPLNITRKYTNITNPAFLASIIVTDTVARTAVARLAGVDLSGVKSIVTDGVQSGAQSVSGAAEEVLDVFRDIFN